MPHSPKPFAQSEIPENSPILHLAVLGPWDRNPIDPVSRAARAVAKELAKRGHILLTAIQDGMAEDLAATSASAGGNIIGFSPAASAHEHTQKFKLPSHHFTTLIYTNGDYQQLQRVIYASADAVIYVCGQESPVWGMVAPFGEPKAIGIVTTSVGQTAEVSHAAKIMTAKEPGIVFENRPKQLIKKLEMIALG